MWGGFCFLELSPVLGWGGVWKCLFVRAAIIFGVGRLLDLFKNCRHCWGGAALRALNDVGGPLREASVCRHAFWLLFVFLETN